MRNEIDGILAVSHEIIPIVRGLRNDDLPGRDLQVRGRIRQIRYYYKNQDSRQRGRLQNEAHAGGPEQNLEDIPLPPSDAS